MEIQGTHLVRKFNFPVVLKRVEAWTSDEIREASERINMELLANARKLGEGRGRGSSNSTFNFDSLLEVVGVENVEDAAEHLVALGSPMILATGGSDWSGTIGGAKKLVENAVKDSQYAAAFRKVEGERSKKDFMFTFKTRPPIIEIVEIQAPDVEVETTSNDEA
jgi:hypothetical protein